jgi:transposase
MSKSRMFETLHSELINILSPFQNNEYVITDTVTVKSMNGSESCGRNPTDRGRNGIKISLICDQKLVVRSVYVSPANIHDAKLLEPTINCCISELECVKCLADSGYAGHEYIRFIKDMTGVKLISKPKNTRNPNIKSHKLSLDDQILLESKRNGIERLIGNIRTFRSLMIKYTKKISSYKTYLYIAILCVSCYNLFASYLNDSGLKLYLQCYSLSFFHLNRNRLLILIKNNIIG